MCRVGNENSPFRPGVGAKGVGHGLAAFEITVSNAVNAAPAKPLTIAVEPTSGSGAIGSVSGVSDGGSSSDSKVTWQLPEGLDPDMSVTRNFLVAFADTAAETQVRWSVTVSRGDTEVIIDDSLSVQVAGTTDAASPVDFTPSQLIRLIAFVVAFAIMAVIFGAWVRNRSADQADGKEARLQYDSDIFREFTQAVVVIVILVAILVLALQGGLSGESAGALIGVVAGYVLGQSVGSR